MPFKTRCQPGDTALIIKATVSENIGKIVHVDSSGGTFKDEPIWLCTAPKPMVCTARYFDTIVLNPIITTTPHIPDSWLIPIKGPSVKLTDDRGLSLPHEGTLPLILTDDAEIDSDWEEF